MSEDGRAVALDMLIESNAGAGLGHDRRERGLADLKRITPQIVAVQLDEVEGLEKYAPVSALVTDKIERSNAVVIAGDSLAVDDAGARAQASQRLDNQREAAGEIVAWRLYNLTCAPVLRGNDAKAVMLDLMQPLAAGGQLIGFGWEARRDAHATQCPWLGTIPAHLNLFYLRISHERSMIQVMRTRFTVAFS